MDYSVIAQASFNQADDKLPADARRKQCVPTSLTFLYYDNFICSAANMNEQTLDEILHTGSQLYCAIKKVENTVTDYIDASLLPKRLRIKSNTVGVKLKNTYTGFIDTSSSNENVLDQINLFSFESAMTANMNRNCSFILVFCDTAVGIKYEAIKNKYYIFDSHSRDENGLSTGSDGHCVLGIAYDLDALVSFIRRLASSLSQVSLCNIQFDLHLFVFVQSHQTKGLNFEIFDNATGYRVKDGNKVLYKQQNVTCSSHVSKKRKSCDETTLYHETNEYDGQKRRRRDENEKLSNCEDIYINEDICNHFKTEVSRGPDYVCSCCTQTFFKHSVKAVNTDQCREAIHKYLNAVISVDRKEWICNTCLKSIQSGRVPKLWLGNGLQFPIKPEELELSNLEERLVSPRLAFMQLREMPRGGQIGIRGNIVNVPSDVNETLKLLPRMPNEHETIMLKLKRRKSHKHHVAFENVRPNKVFSAAKWLVENSDLFQNEGIQVDENWLMSVAHEEYLFPNNNQTSSEEVAIHSDLSDAWTEDEFQDRPTGNTDTFLQAADFREFNQILSVAPAEDNIPLSIFQDWNSEILAFPSIYCGKSRPQNNERTVPLHYSDICKWELRNVDRRVALCVPNIFYKLKRVQIKQIKDKVTLALRKCKTKGKAYSAGEILSPGFIDNLTMQDDGYRVLRNIRGSPPYWEQAKRDAFAMIRQLGMPTWFCSFSAAETKWEPLLCSLSKLVKKENVSSDEIENLSWQDKCILIKSDPVTCARYFDFRVQSFMKHILFHPMQPVGEVIDYFYRVEFQQRGSPHIHLLLWIKNAPSFDHSSSKEVSTFVEKYTTCAKDENIKQLINYQTHRHAKTCRKKGKASCRFNFPIPPMPETVVLQPLEKSEVNTIHNDNFQLVINKLNELQKNQEYPSFLEFLNGLDITKEEYLMAIRSSLKRATVFLRRKLSEVRVNSYNRTLLTAWEANMDIQFILDPYSCVSYIVSYVSKGQRGLSNLLSQACEEAKDKNSSIREQVRSIGNQFLSSVEIGAQEAAYLLLQMSLRRSTRQVVFVDTNISDRRTNLIKSFSDLKDLPKTSKNIEMDSTLKRYMRRPIVLQNTCYADFASWYDLSNKEKKKKKDEENNSLPELPEDEYNLDTTDDIGSSELHTDDTIIRFPCGLVMKKRKKQKVIYWQHTSINTDRENHFREQLMLFTAWYDDEKDLIGEFESFESSYDHRKHEINVVKALYEGIDHDLYENLTYDFDADDTINPENQHREMVDENDGILQSDEFLSFNAENVPGEHDYDIGEDIGQTRKNLSNSIEITSNDWKFSELCSSIQHLNHEQKMFFYHILHTVKTSEDPFYTFLSGGAGVGKSVLVKTIYQAVKRYYDHTRNHNPDTIKLLLCAPTGKAAHNINGNTIHSAFSIPVSQGFHFKPLDMQQLNTMRSRFKDLKLIIIDEVSMVGRNMFNFISLRLQEVTGSSKPFGGISILAVGDLFQLKPVMDSWIFSPSNSISQMSTLGTNLWTDLFTFFELTKIMRQKDDMEFALLLNRLREGCHTDHDIELLRSRCCFAEDVSTVPHIFCRKVDAFAHNQSVLSALHIQSKINVKAIDTVSGNVNKSLHEKIISKVPNDSSKTMGLPSVLTLGIGVPCDITLNVDISDGLTNGASCVVRKFDFRVPQSDRCSIVWVEFDDKIIGLKWKQRYKHLYLDDTDPNWVPIIETTRKFPVKSCKTYLIVRRQFPLAVSAGKTIHKSQGSTMNSCVMHFGNRSVPHLHYVGLSRVRSLSGAKVLNLNEEKITTCSVVQEEMERLRNTRSLKSCVPSIAAIIADLKLVCHNCRSLRKHFDDIKLEYDSNDVDILCFLESRLHDSWIYHQFNLDGYNFYSSRSTESAHGIVVYTRCRLQQFSVHTISGIECAFLKPSQNILICFVYCPPKASTESNFASFQRQIMTENTENVIILMGDFNYDFQEMHPVSSLMKSYNLQQLIQSTTTDYGSCLDHIYTNASTNKLVSYGVLESYFSDHKPIYLALNL